MNGLIVQAARGAVSRFLEKIGALFGGQTCHLARLERCGWLHARHDTADPVGQLLPLPGWVQPALGSPRMAEETEISTWFKWRHRWDWRHARRARRRWWWRRNRPCMQVISGCHQAMRKINVLQLPASKWMGAGLRGGNRLTSFGDCARCNARLQSWVHQNFLA